MSATPASSRTSDRRSARLAAVVVILALGYVGFRLLGSEPPLSWTIATPRLDQGRHFIGVKLTANQAVRIGRIDTSTDDVTLPSFLSPDGTCSIEAGSQYSFEVAWTPGMLDAPPPKTVDLTLSVVEPDTRTVTIECPLGEWWNR